MRNATLNMSGGTNGMNMETKYIFCDESRQDLLASKKSITETNEYICIGGIMIPAHKLDQVKADILELRKKYNVYGELKWGTVTRGKLDFYLDIIKYFFNDDDMDFRTIVIDAAKINNDKFNNSDQELGYYKFYYELLNHWIKRDTFYRIYTDQKTNCDASRLRELRRIVNISCHRTEPVLSIQAINSKESVILQIENILMGAVGYKYNWGLSGISEPKNRVVQEIEKELGHKIASTGKNVRKFNVFEIALQEGR